MLKYTCIAGQYFSFELLSIHVYDCYRQLIIMQLIIMQVELNNNVVKVSFSFFGKLAFGMLAAVFLSYGIVSP